MVVTLLNSQIILSDFDSLKEAYQILQWCHNEGHPVVPIPICSSPEQQALQLQEVAMNAVIANATMTIAARTPPLIALLSSTIEVVLSEETLEEDAI